MNEIVPQVSSVGLTLPGNIPFDPSSWDWDRQASPNTLRAYVNALTRFRAWLDTEGIDPFAATKSDVVRYLGTTGMAGASVRQALAAIRRAYKEAGAFNPAAAIRPPKLDEPSLDVLSHNEAKRLLRSTGKAADTGSVRAIRDHALLSLTLFSGVRRDGIVSLAVGDLDLEGDSPTMTFRNKGGNKRTIKLPSDAADALAPWLALRPDADPSAPLFSSVVGSEIGDQELHANTPANIFNHWLKVSKVRKKAIGFHALRRTCAVLAYDAGAPVEIIQASLGHARVDTTLHYIRSAQRQTKSAGDYIRL